MQNMYSYLLIIIMPIEGAFLFALFTVDWGTIFNFRICASLTFISYESCDNVTILTCCWFSIRLNILFALFTNSAGASFSGLLKLGPTICAFNYWKCPTTLLIGQNKNFLIDTNTAFLFLIKLILL